MIWLCCNCCLLYILSLLLMLLLLLLLEIYLNVLIIFIVRSYYKNYFALNQINKIKKDIQDYGCLNHVELVSKNDVKNAYLVHK